ncbi:MAG: CRISPR-associated helicase Cas3', partial [Fibrobacter sp.]|nr:CRISPR-associated helicase Cas3' [Fibrobacter sp.]
YWGKADKDNNYHLLVYHCLDDAAVGDVWLKKNRKKLKKLSKDFGLSVEAFREWLLFFFSIHDIGKFSITFQNLKKALLKQLQGIENNSSYEVRHDQLGWELFDTFLSDLLCKSHFDGSGAKYKEIINIFAFFTFGHHGIPTDMGSSTGVKRFSKNDEQAVSRFFCDMKDFFLSEESIGELRKIVQSSRDERKAKIARLKQNSWYLAGLITICDWIGSGDGFEFCMEEKDLKSYYESRLECAKGAIDRAEVICSKVSSECGFKYLFPAFESTKTPLQNLCDTIEIENDKGPQLWILEDVTGAGKTEAAMTLVSRIIANGGGNGCFIALPTMATSNAMYERMASVYRLLFDKTEKPSLVLSHGSRHLSETFRKSYKDTFVNLPDDTMLPEDEEQEGIAHCAQWLADSSKKSMLADCGVGTVDQILLGGLPLRYQNLRIFGMHKKVIVIDEVHAYDAYMIKLLEKILCYHASTGGSVILLSATLPQSVRKKLVDSFTDGLGVEKYRLAKAEFPLVTAVNKCSVLEKTIDTREDLKRSVKVVFHDNHESIENLIVESALSGKCVCWIRNTIGDAIESYSKLRDSGKIDPEKLEIFHSRMALRDRLLVEKKVLGQFGKKSNASDRQGRILIATQVVEQSLDLDFDILISDLAPVDLLIQRAGRLHRHYRNALGNCIDLGEKTDRPDPVFYIYVPPETEIPSETW